MSKLNAYPLKQVHTDLFELVATVEGVGGAFETIRISKAAMASFILATAPGGSGGTAGADGSGGIVSGNFTIANNGVAVWQLPANSAGMGAIYLAALGATPTTQFMFAGDAVNLMIAGGVAYKTVVLTGTTGSASAVSFSIVGDKLYVENRMGWSVTVCVFLSVGGVKQ